MNEKNVPKAVLGGTVGSMAAGPVGGVVGAGMGAGKIKNPFSNKVDIPDAQARPDWLLSGADGKLREDLLLGKDMPGAFKQSQGVLDKLLGQATATGPSQTAKYLQEANRQGNMKAISDADKLAQSGLAQATGQLAMRGGLDSGARERLAKASSMESLMNKQRLTGDMQSRDMDILAKDEADKSSMLRALPSSLMAQAGMEQGNKQFDIANTLQTLGNKYQNDMGGWAANQAAREQAMLANKKSGLLGLGFMGVL